MFITFLTSTVSELIVIYQRFAVQLLSEKPVHEIC
jgi:hypothetical protein